MPQSLSKLYVHLIFSTKHRQPILTSSVRGSLYAYLAAVLKNQDCPALKVGGSSDHAHLLFRLSKNLSLAEVVEEVRRAPRSGSRPKAKPYSHFIGKAATAAFLSAPPRSIHWQRTSRGKKNTTGR